MKNKKSKTKEIFKGISLFFIVIFCNNVNSNDEFEIINNKLDNLKRLGYFKHPNNFFDDKNKYHNSEEEVFEFNKINNNFDEILNSLGMITINNFNNTDLRNKYDNLDYEIILISQEFYLNSQKLINVKNFLSNKDIPERLRGYTPVNLNYAKEEYRKIWEYVLLKPYDANTIIYSHITALGHIGIIKNNDSLPIIEFYFKSINRDIFTDEKRNLESTLRCILCYNNLESTLVIIKCIKHNRSVMEKDEKQAEVFLKNDFILNIDEFLIKYLIKNGKYKEFLHNLDIILKNDDVSKNDKDIYIINNLIENIKNNDNLNKHKN
jgi:hypothetical protein